MIHAIRQRVPISSSVLIRLTVLVGLVVMLLGIGFVAPRVSPALVLIAVAAPLVVLLALSRIEYGVLAIILTAAFVRFSLPTGTQSRIVASLLMTVIFIALWLAAATRPGKPRWLVHHVVFRLSSACCPGQFRQPPLGSARTARASRTRRQAFPREESGLPVTLRFEVR